jgi:hypothetical protein
MYNGILEEKLKRSENITFNGKVIYCKNNRPSLS